jgi:hypothetical protein
VVRVSITKARRLPFTSIATLAMLGAAPGGTAAWAVTGTAATAAPAAPPARIARRDTSNSPLSLMKVVLGRRAKARMSFDQ